MESNESMIIFVSLSLIATSKINISLLLLNMVTQSKLEQNVELCDNVHGYIVNS
jgi:hypothetical protein